MVTMPVIMLEKGGDGDRRKVGGEGQGGSLYLSMSLPLTEMTPMNTSWKVKAMQSVNQKGQGTEFNSAPETKESTVATSCREADEWLSPTATEQGRLHRAGLRLATLTPLFSESAEEQAALGPSFREACASPGRRPAKDSRGVVP